LIWLGWPAKRTLLDFSIRKKRRFKRPLIFCRFYWLYRGFRRGWSCSIFHRFGDAERQTLNVLVGSNLIRFLFCLLRRVGRLGWFRVCVPCATWLECHAMTRHR